MPKDWTAFEGQPRSLLKAREAEPDAPPDLITPLLGCLECGRIGWTRSGERVDGAGEEAGYAEVRKAPRTGQVGGDWVGDCGHVVPADSNLARCLDAIPPHGIARLALNREEQMEDWRPSATL